MKNSMWLAVLTTCIIGLVAAADELPDPEKVHAFVEVKFPVDGELRSLVIHDEHATVDEAREKHAGQTLLVLFRGRKLNLDKLPPGDGDGCLYWLSYVHNPTGQADVPTFVQCADLPQARKKLDELQALPGFKYPKIYCGKVVR